MAAATDREVLPDTVVPSHYAITLRPELEQATFTGEETITVQIRQATTTISLNASELTVTRGAIRPKGTTEWTLAAELRLETALERLHLQFAAALQPGEYELHLAFSGTLNDNMAGFYRSEYTNAAGEKRNMAVTQFEATDARKAFPCWDEPARKAVFQINLDVPSNRVALSNMNVVRTTPTENGARQLVEFAPSPIMSTYLVAFVVGELDYIEDTTSLGIKVRVYTPPGLSEQGRFALEVATKTLTFFAEYFGEPYPLPKMDLVAVPDFAAGAMENWGLVTYRTVYLLFDAEKSSVRAKQNIAYVVGHELAHQWFGNLVTMEWWTHLWLNEGFATYVGWLAVDRLFPEWGVWTQFLVQELIPGLRLDALRSSHPIEVDVQSPNQINQIFDAISYSKDDGLDGRFGLGASVIQMLVDYLGNDAFVRGVRLYLQRHKYANATTGDLWRALSEASGVNVSDMMVSWTKQVGYPAVTIDGSGTVKQTRFLSSGNVTDEEKQATWWVPLRIVHGNAPEAPSNDILKDTQATVPSAVAQGEHFVKANFRNKGFYRVQYTAEMLQRLGPAIRSKKLSAADRVGIISDAFALSYAGLQSTVDTLSLLLNYVDEDNFVVWDEIASSVANLRSVWYQEPESVGNDLKALARKLFVPQAKRLGWDFGAQPNHADALLRSLVIAGAAKAGDPETLAAAQDRFRRYVAGEADAVHPNLRSGVFAAVIIHGGETEFNQLQQIYESATLPDLKQAALTALGATQDPALVERDRRRHTDYAPALKYSESAAVRSQDVPFLLGALSANPKGRHLLWNYVKNNWTALYQRFNSAFMVSRIVGSATECFVTSELAAEIEAFFNARPAEELAAVDRTLKQSLERIRANERWLQRDRAAVAAWLQANIKA